MGTLSAISAFWSLNKLGPLVAVYKIGYLISAYTLQDQLCQIWAHFDHLKIYFRNKNSNCAYPLSNAALKKWRPSLRSGLNKYLLKGRPFPSAQMYIYYIPLKVFLFIIHIDQSKWRVINSATGKSFEPSWEVVIYTSFFNVWVVLVA